MPRIQREVSPSGYYHIILRGNGRQNLFESSHDMELFMLYVDRAVDGTSIELIAWCLMDNHVHLLVFDPDNQSSQFVKRFATSYAMHFNKVADRVGHVFQDRYRSIAIKSDQQLLDTVKYIHFNPEKSMVCKQEEYRWSSYHEYLGSPVRINPDIVFEMIGGIDEFEAFSRERAPVETIVSIVDRISKEDSFEAAKAIAGVDDLASLKSLSKATRNEALGKLRASGFSIRQIERMTGIGRGTIARVTVQKA